jgi:hypothetical protein
MDNFLRPMTIIGRSHACCAKLKYKSFADFYEFKNSIPHFGGFSPN